MLPKDVKNRPGGNKFDPGQYYDFIRVIYCTSKIALGLSEYCRQIVFEIRYEENRVL